ncbi:GNAT family N-acetyltransferase [Nitratireductor kimnyeongensis]|uniref:GNAT family N-acetyltransferase n=1 Tax=Nitratireductor kimnyeongensis TaxID=430679 RepID=A0ABW0T8A5_9HYPH|nr:GNAT family N-acetyltransferase [Nitratireductor kimnyeongensis]QZZ36063.1 GNAT family N-acetyltransferase [Nitratireductor kimnyeongensis]
MQSAATLSIERVDAIEAQGLLPELAGLLHACVHDGASIGFILPFGMEESARFWQEKIFPAIGSGGRILLVARQGGRLAGSVQLVVDTPPNQPHRAEASKLLVAPACRRQGVGRGLMSALEGQARSLGRSLITLDTRTGDKAEPLYAALGFSVAGIVPDYCRDPFLDRLDATTIMYKRLRTEA